MHIMRAPLSATLFGAFCRVKAGHVEALVAAIYLVILRVFLEKDYEYEHDHTIRHNFGFHNIYFNNQSDLCYCLHHQSGVAENDSKISACGLL